MTSSPPILSLEDFEKEAMGELRDWIEEQRYAAEEKSERWQESEEAEAHTSLLDDWENLCDTFDYAERKPEL